MTPIEWTAVVEDVEPNPFSALDDYELRHVVEHLVAARRVADLMALMRMETADERHAWFEAKESRGLGAAFVDDVYACRRVLEATADEELRVSGIAPAIGHEVRLALLAASANSVSHNVPPPLIGASVEAGIWSVGRGLEHARRFDHPLLRAEALAACCPALDTAARGTAVREALVALDDIRFSDDWRARAIKALVPFLTDADLQQRAFAQARRASGCRLAEALAALVSIATPDDRHALVEEAARAAEVDDAYDRAGVAAEVYARLAAVATEPVRRAELVRAALDQAEHALAEAEMTWDAWTVIADLVPSGALRSWLVRVRLIPDERRQAEGLAALAGRLPEALVRDVRSSADAIEDPAWRAFALTGVVPRMGGPARRNAAQAARDAVLAVSDIGRQGRLAAVTAGVLPADEGEALLRRVLRRRRSCRVRVMSWIWRRERTRPVRTTPSWRAAPSRGFSTIRGPTRCGARRSTSSRWRST